MVEEVLVWHVHNLIVEVHLLVAIRVFDIKNKFQYSLTSSVESACLARALRDIAIDET